MAPHASAGFHTTMIRWISNVVWPMATGKSGQCVPTHGKVYRVDFGSSLNRWENEGIDAIVSRKSYVRRLRVMRR